MRKTVALPFIAIALASVIAAGCSGTGGYNPSGNSAPTPTPLPSATGQCVLPAGETVQMIFPIPSQSLAPNQQGVVFAVSPNPLPTNWYMYATSSFGSTQNTNSIAFLGTPAPAPGSTAGSTPTPLPTPSAAPIVANPIYETASIGIFTATNPVTTFSIFLANTTCAQGIAQGSFTTGQTDIPSPTPAPTGT
jgi:hypothetical protein